jgi:nitrate/nitrite transporter NarK
LYRYKAGELFSLTALLGMASAPVGGVIADKIGLKSVIVVSLAMCAVGLGLAQEAVGLYKFANPVHP